MLRLEAVSRRETVDQLRRCRLRDPARELVRLARARAVPALPYREEDEQPLEVLGRHRHAHPVERVGEPVREAALPQERHELQHRPAARLQVAMVLLRQMPHENVERDALAFELRRHLDGEKRVG
jgi:hypothetical protein